MTLGWLLVIIGGPVILGLALAYAKFRAGRQNRQLDPTRAADDPSRGMNPKP